MREFFDELVLWFFLAMGFLLLFVSVKGFLKVTLPNLPVPVGLKEAFA